MRTCLLFLDSLFQKMFYVNSERSLEGSLSRVSTNFFTYVDNSVAFAKMTIFCRLYLHMRPSSNTYQRTFKIPHICGKSIININKDIHVTMSVEFGTISTLQTKYKIRGINIPLHTISVLFSMSTILLPEMAIRARQAKVSPTHVSITTNQILLNMGLIWLEYGTY